MSTRSGWSAALMLGGLLACAPAAPAEEQRNMRLVGADDLQARSAYQPVVHHQGARWIAYVGHHGGKRMNPLTGQEELNGTSIVDVTDPKHPRYLHHIPGAEGLAEAGGRPWCGCATARRCRARRRRRPTSCARSATSRTRSGT